MVKSSTMVIIILTALFFFLFKNMKKIWFKHKQNATWSFTLFHSNNKRFTFLIRLCGLIIFDRLGRFPKAWYDPDRCGKNMALELDL